MTLPLFPPELEYRPLRETFSIGTGDTRRLFQPDSAPLAPRARYSTAARPVAMTIEADRNGLAVFDHFYEVTLGNGARPFLMPDPATDGWPLLDADGAPMLMGDGTPILLAATWVCLFSAAVPVRTPVGNRFRIAFGIGVMP
jgi:hypothetical protein